MNYVYITIRVYYIDRSSLDKTIPWEKTYLQYRTLKIEAVVIKAVISGWFKTIMIKPAEMLVPHDMDAWMCRDKRIVEGGGGKAMFAFG